MDNFSNLMMVNECLLDKERVRLFTKAIFSSVKPGDVVLDAGSGSGILSFLAIKAGAKLVYAVEIDPVIGLIVENNAKSLGYSEKVVVINADIKKFSPPMVDAVIMEMLDTWLVAEQQIPAINNLVKVGCITNITKVIPERVENYIQPANYDFNFYGFCMPQPVQARNFGVMRRVKKVFSPPLLVDKLDFKVHNALRRSGQVIFCSQESGLLNAVILKTKLFITKSVVTWGTTDMNMPVIIPVEPVSVIKGERLRIDVSYTVSYGFDKVVVKINKV